MFPYSFGVQAPTKEKAKSDLAAQADKLGKDHPDQVETYGRHVAAVVDAAGALIDMLPPDDKATDVAASAAGYLTVKKPAEKDDEIQVEHTSFTAHAGRVPVDASKYEPEPKEPKDKKVVKDAKGAAK